MGINFNYIRIRKNSGNIPVKNILFIIFLGIFFMCPFILKAQQNSIQTVDHFVVKNESIASAIEKLSIKTGMNFSFNAGDKALKKKINYQAENKTVSSILNEILNPINRSFKQIGTQIVIFKPETPLVNPAKNTAGKKNTDSAAEISPLQIAKTERKIPVTDTIIITDTLMLRDTVILRDTIIRTDTLIKRDTVFVTKKKNKRKKQKSFPTDYFNRQESRESGWSVTLYLSPLLTTFTFTGEEKPLSLRSILAGSSVSKLSNNWGFSFSVQFTNFANRFNYAKTTTEGGYYEPDTVDAYYTIVDNDTNWFYVTDSTWLPLKTYETVYEKTNRIGYLDVSVQSAYTFYKTEKLRLHISGGVQSSFPVYTDGLYAEDKSSGKWLDFADLTFASPLISVVAGGGLKYRLNRNFDFSGNLFYTYYFGSVITNPVKTIKTDYLGLKLGIAYYFK